jgi:hypothetical protein
LKIQKLILPHLGWMVLLAAGSLGLLSPAEGADRDPAWMFGEGGFPDRSSVDYQFRDSFGDPGESPTLTEQRENARIILSKTAKETWSLQQRFSHFNLNGPVTVPQIGLEFPRSLWSLGMGAGVARQLEKDRRLGLNFSVGSESDRLFHTLHETDFQGNASYRFPTAENRAWLLFLSYSNNRHFLNNVPLPGFAYSIRSPSYGIRAIIGFPFLAISYAPTTRFNARFSLFGPRRVSAEAGYKIAGPVRLYGGFEWTPQEWIRAGRQDRSNRLFFDKKRLLTGVETPVFRGLMLDLSGGREFDRRFFENDSSSTRDISYASLPPAWFLETKLSFRFGPSSPQ